MTDADLARWEHDCETTLAGLAEYDAADVILPLIAEVRRLRAEMAIVYRAPEKFTTFHVETETT